MNYYASFVNLDSRPDRLAHMKAQLSRVGIQAERYQALTPNQVRIKPDRIRAMMNRPQKGAIGCHFSQVGVMKKALNLGQHAFVMEDDLVFCSDFQERFEIIGQFLSKNEWDVLWLGGTYHLDPTWHKTGHPELPQCSCNLNRDWEPTEHPQIVRTYGCWGTYAYIVNHSSIGKILQMFEDHLPDSIGIDWLFILLQPHLKTFAFNPGCVKQMDNRSDIGKGDTIFSNFAKLGPHWWADKMHA